MRKRKPYEASKLFDNGTLSVYHVDYATPDGGRAQVIEVIDSHAMCMTALTGLSYSRAVQTVGEWREETPSESEVLAFFQQYLELGTSVPIAQ